MTDHYTEIAAQLRRIADDLDTLAGNNLPRPWVSFSIQPHGATDDEIVDGVDSVAGALLGKPGSTRQLSGGTYHHDASGNGGAVRIGVYNQVAGPKARERDTEVSRLRAQAAALTGTATAVAG